MSYSEDSMVTNTAVSSPYGRLSDIGSPGVDRPPVMLEDPYAYVAQLPLDFVSEPVYPEFMPAEDEVFSVEEQPLPDAALPTDQSPGYILESDPKEDPKKDDEDPKEDPANYPTNRDDDDEEEEEEEPSGYDADDEDEDEDEEEEEEEKHPAPADSVPPVHRMTARISIRAEPSISLPPREEVERLLALTTPPPSPLTPLSSPLPQISSPPLPVPPPIPILPPSLPTSPTYQLRYQAVMIRLRVETPFTSHTPPSGTPPLLPIPAPISSPPILLPFIDRRADRPEVCLPPRKRLCFTQGPGYEVGDSSFAAAARLTRGHRADYRFVGTIDDTIRQWRAEEVGYEIRDAWVDPREAAEEVAPMTLKGVNTRVTEIFVIQGQDTQDIYAVIEDTQDRQTQMYQRVEALVKDRSQNVTSEMAALWTANHTRQEQLVQTLTLMQSLHVTPRQGGNVRRNVMDIITTQWCQP
ncbi:hypothetical protein Tco_1123162 [Tanacetum coccineum]|uniref:Uncharacterized protein n=1 Tax=Tanacetum coccineum TaxID=301880 RepID=A0ABQ5J2J6_9ASTR